MNRSEKFNFYLPGNTDYIIDSINALSDNFETVDENLITAEQNLTSEQKAAAYANLDLGNSALHTVANDLNVSSAGYVLDARQGKVLNDNATANGNAVSAIENGIAIVSNGNTHGAISEGQYVYVMNHSSLSEGLYIASTNIAANATLSTSNVAAQTSEGALNSLKDYVSNHTLTTYKEWSTSIDIQAIRTGGIVRVSGYLLVPATTFTESMPILVINGVVPNPSNVYCFDSAGNTLRVINNNSRTEVIFHGGKTIGAASYLFVNFTYNV